MAISHVINKKICDTIKENNSSKGFVDSLVFSPPGGKLAEELVALSNWYSALNDNNKIMLQRVVDMTADSCMFGFFSVIDGVRSIEEVENKGELELYYVNGDIKERLNNPDVEYLHDIYKLRLKISSIYQACCILVLVCLQIYISMLWDYIIVNFEQTC